ncbi:PREDICTED: putative ER lumen protein-retaining receptor C28H8.4 [Nelumbo nucifera]|uniref:ER lumen protein-retaining receptor C28H8.4 n=2 Tax=Nelumbo nucifera TaxID=4432 RepID=A0A822Y5R5_NELNU|nr:PREDICTED: putative ER lumen protein-retaining receptor C28H8.4 [Nelumbo nucifera]DAD27797.1 TPA_asm: hypothetical protein HUJ06_029265 [Nelumbo nucifera]
MRRVTLICKRCSVQQNNRTEYTGLSLKSQELTAISLAVRLYCSFVMEYDIHTILDSATLGTTLWVIYMICFKLKSNYMEDKDNFAIYYVVIPCALLDLLVHPSTTHHLFNRIAWAFCVYMEVVSVLPQLRVMQNAKIVEPFTVHYVFALGIARFLSCAHWVLHVIIYAVLYLKLSRAWMSVGVNQENKAQRLLDILKCDRSGKKGGCVILFDKLIFF